MKTPSADVLQGSFRKQVGGMGIVLAVPALVLFILEWMAARVLGPVSVGEVLNYLIPAQALSALILLGLPSTMTWLAANTGQGRAPIAVSTILGPSLVVGGLAGVLWFSGITRPEIEPGVPWQVGAVGYCGTFIIASSMALIWEAVLIGRGHIRIVAVSAVLSGLVSVGIGAWGLRSGPTLAMVALPMGLAAGSLLRWLIALAVLTRFGVWKWDHRILLPPGLAAFALAAGAVAVVNALSTWADRMIVMASLVSSPDQLAYYRYGARELPLLSSLIGAFSPILLARLSLGQAPDGTERFHTERERWLTTTRALWAILIPVGCIVGVHAPILFEWVYGPGWSASAPYFRVYLLLLLVRAMPLMVLLQAEGHQKAIILGALIDLGFAAGLGSLLVLGLGWGPMAAAGSFVAGTLVQGAYYAWVIHYKVGLEFPRVALLRTLSVAGLLMISGVTLTALFSPVPAIVVHALLAGGFAVYLLGRART